MNSRGRGIAVLAAVVADVLLFLTVPDRLVRYLALLQFLVIAVSWLFALIARNSIHVRRDVDTPRGIKHQETRLILTIRNASILSHPYLAVSDSHGSLFAPSDSFLLHLGPLEQKELSYPASGRNRGIVGLGPTELGGSDPFGFFPWSKRVDTPGMVVVYPTIHTVSFLDRRGLPSGNLPVDDRMYEDVTRFRSLREYVPGDDIKRVNWKASAKHNSLLTMEYDSTLYFPVVVVLNFSRDDYPLRQREALLEVAAEYAASVPFYYATIGQEVGFISSGRVAGEDAPPVPVKGGYEHAQSILDLVAELEAAEGHADFDQLFYGSGIGFQTGTKTVVVSPPLRPRQADELIAARRRGVNLIVVQIESHTERVDDESYAGILPVVPIGRQKGDELHG